MFLSLFDSGWYSKEFLLLTVDYVFDVPIHELGGGGKLLEPRRICLFKVQEGLYGDTLSLKSWINQRFISEINLGWRRTQ